MITEFTLYNISNAIFKVVLSGRQSPANAAPAAEELEVSLQTWFDLAF
jgi:hypothetical protein